MSGENDYLFQNFDNIITVDYNKLKLMIGELHKTQKKHSDSLLEIFSVIYNTEKEDEIYRRLGLLESKQEQFNETVNNIQKKSIEIEANVFDNQIHNKNIVE